MSPIVVSLEDSGRTVVLSGCPDGARLHAFQTVAFEGVSSVNPANFTNTGFRQRFTVEHDVECRDGRMAVSVVPRVHVQGPFQNVSRSPVGAILAEPALD